MKTNKTALGLACAAALLAGGAQCMELTETPDGIAVANSIYKARLSVKGGAIKSLMLKAGNIELTGGTGTGSSIEDKSSSTTGLNQQYEMSIAEKSRERTAISFKAPFCTSFPSGLVCEKTYIFTENSPVIEASVKIINQGGGCAVSYRAHNIINAIGKYFAANASGMEEIVFPEHKSSFYFENGKPLYAGFWNRENKTAVVVKTDPDNTKKLLFWLGNKESTIEWWYETLLMDKDYCFETTYAIALLENVPSPQAAYENALKLTASMQNAGKMTFPPVNAEKVLASDKILIAGQPYDADVLSCYCYRIFEALGKFPFKVDFSRCELDEFKFSKSHYLYDFPFSLGGLAEYRVVIIVDMPGWVFPAQFQKVLLAYVEAGGTLIFVGDQGRGYKDSPLAAAMPLGFDYTNEVPNRAGPMLDDKTGWLKGKINEPDHPILRGLPPETPAISVHKSVLKENGVLLMSAGNYALLTEKKIGRGRLISFPLSLSVEKQVSRAGGDINYDTWDDKLINWDFYPRLWKNIIQYCMAKNPPVDFCGVTAPAKNIMLQEDWNCKYALKNYADKPEKIVLKISAQKDGNIITNETKTLTLEPGQTLENILALKAEWPPAKYSYCLEISGEKNNILTCLEGNFTAGAATTLKVELPIIRVFKRNGFADAAIAVQNAVKDKKYRIKTCLLDKNNRTMIDYGAAEAAADKPLTQHLTLGNLKEDSYQLAWHLSEGGKNLDLLKEDIYLSAGPEKTSYPIAVIGGAEGSVKMTAETIAQMKDIGFNIVMPYIWKNYKKGRRNTRDSRLRFYALEEAQRQGMGFMGCVRPGKANWMRFWNGCPVNEMDTNTLMEAVSDINDYREMYQHCPGYIATYIADEPDIEKLNPPWDKCPDCRAAFQKEYGFEMPQDRPEDRNNDPRYFYANAFMCRKAAEAMTSDIGFFKFGYGPSGKISLGISTGALKGGLDMKATIQNADIIALDHYSWGRDPYHLDLLNGAADFKKGKIWLLAAAYYHVQEPEYLGTQLFNTIAHNANGIIYWAWGGSCGHMITDPKRPGCAKKAFQELKEVAPLFLEVNRKRALAAMMHPLTSLVLEYDAKRTYSGTAPAYNLCRKTFGQVDILQERHVADGDFLADYKILVLFPQTFALERKTMESIKAWVRAGNTLVIFPGTWEMNEDRKPDDSLYAATGFNWGRELKETVPEFGDSKVDGREIKAGDGVEVLYRYANNMPAAIKAKYGNGRVIACGFLPEKRENFTKILGDIEEYWFINSADENVDINLFQEKDSYYIVAVNQEKAAALTTVELKIPQDNYVVCDLVSGEKLAGEFANGRLKITVQAAPLWGRILAVFKDQPAGLLLETGRETYKPGDYVSYDLTITNAAGQQFKGALLPVTITVQDPQKNVCREYSGVRIVKNGKAQDCFRLADNDQLGEWTMEVKEKTGNLAVSKSFKVQGKK